MASNSTLLKVSGLYTFPNHLSGSSPGALLVASNLVINRDNVGESRRGYKLYGTAMGSSTSVTAKQLLTYKGRIFRHYATSLDYDTNASGTFQGFSFSLTGTTHTSTTIDGFTTTAQIQKGMSVTGTGIAINTTVSSITGNNAIVISPAATGSATVSLTFTVNVSETASGVRLKSLEANGNLYFTSSKGIQKISASSVSDLSTAIITPAGGIQALDLNVVTNTTDGGWFNQESVVGYRALWGIKDANQNLVAGVPSSRAVVYNPLTNLLINDFNNVLGILDTLNLTGGVHAGNYVSTLKVPANSSASTLNTGLQSLAAKIDADTVVTAAHATVSGQVTSNVATVIFGGSMANYLAAGNTVVISGFAGANAVLNGTRVISTVSTTTITFPVTTADYGVTASGAGVVQRLKYSLIPHVTLDTVPTTNQLVAMQSYYSVIVSDLQNELSGIATGSMFNGSDATTTATTNISFVIPNGVTTAYFYQIYRTQQTTAATGTSLYDIGNGDPYDPGDEEQLVYESNPTIAELNSGSISLTDITTDSFLGAYLYTNPESGSGILQANARPPFANDIATFKGYTFFSNTQSLQTLNLSMLSVVELVSGVSTFTTSDGTVSGTNTYTFVSAVAEVQTVTTVADSAGSLNNKWFNLYSGNNLTHYYVWYNVNSAGTDPAIAGATGIEVAIATNTTANNVATATKNALNIISDFTVTVGTDIVNITNTTKGISTSASNGTASPGFTYAIITPGTGEDPTNKKVLISALSTPAQQVAETSQSLIRVINYNRSDVANGFYLSGSTDVPGLILLQGKDISQSTFSVGCNALASTGMEFIPNVPTQSGTSLSSLTSSNDTKPNRIYYSKYNQPEAVPLLNYIDVGPQDEEITRILALRDNLVILKAEGIYLLSGVTSPFSVALFDSSTLIKAHDSAVVLNNLIYLYSSQGIATVSSTGVAVISRPIEDQIISLFTPQYTNFDSATFGVSYESDRSYYLFTVTNTTDTVATQCLRFNSFTNTWTKLDLSKTCGIINQLGDDVFYLGASDTDYIEKERKDFDRTDYADREISINLAASSVNGTTVTLPSVSQVSARDVLYQLQYLTIDQFNRCLSQLDRDAFLSPKDYVDTLTANPGDNLSEDLDALLTKVANDAGRQSHVGFTPAVDYTNLIGTGSASFSALQTVFNSFIALLNADVGVSFTTYATSSGTVPFEFIIQSKNTPLNTILAPYVYPLIVGPIIVYNHINVTVQWSPQYLGDVALTKHVSEGTYIFEDASFSQATISYATDLSADFEPITINGNGNGIYGNNVYGQGLYGGNGSGIPFRSLLPRNKQRCRYVNVRYQHSTAREIFSLYGISLKNNVMSTRGWR